jgi:hypothetical protein
MSLNGGKMNKTIASMAILSAVFAIGTALATFATAPAYGAATTTAGATTQGTSASAATADPNRASSCSAAEELGFRSARAENFGGDAVCRFEP